MGAEEKKIKMLNVRNVSVSAKRNINKVMVTLLLQLHLISAYSFSTLPSSQMIRICRSPSRIPPSTPRPSRRMLEAAAGKTICAWNSRFVTTVLQLTYPKSCSIALRRDVGRHSSCRHFSIKASTATSDADTYEALVSWLRGVGGQVHRAIQFVDDDVGGRGLLVKEDVRRGERLIVVPEKGQIFYNKDPKQMPPNGDVDSETALLALINTVNPALWGIQLALKLLQEKVKCDTSAGTSSFCAYINSLPAPASYHGMPAYYTQAGTKHLQFPDVQRQAAGRKEQLMLLAQTSRALRGTAADPFSGATIDLEALTWATASVTSRAFRVRGLPGQRGGHLASLVPVVDLINHAFEPNVFLDDAAGP